MLPRIATLSIVLAVVAACASVLAQSPSPAPTPNSAGSADQQLPRLPETEVLGEAPSAAPGPAAPGGPRSVLEGTVFASPPATGYRADSSTTATLVDVPNIDIPGSVDVVTQDLRRDQHVLQVDDLLRDVAGAVKIDDDRRPDSFILRGFLVTSRDYRKDGFLDPTYTPRDFADVERIEIVKGPSSVLYGANQPCGSVNFITKQPLDQAQYSGSVQIGSFNLERYTVDATGPLNEDKSTLYRVIGAYQDQDSFRDFGFMERSFVAPSMAWVLDDATTLVWQGEYVNDRQRYDTGVAAVNGQLVLPINRYLGEPNDFQQFHDYRQSLVLNHRINEDWSWKLGAYSLFYDAPSAATIPVAPAEPSPPYPVPPTGVFERAQQYITPFDEQYQSVIANLAGKMQGGEFTHNLVVGSEIGWFTSDHFTATQTSPFAGEFLFIDGFAPVYGTVPPHLPPAIEFDSTFYQADYGLYFQDLIEVGPHWKVLAGVRYDHVDTTFNRSFEPEFGPTKTDQTLDEGSPRVGLVYEAVPERLSYYGMYGESFTPPPGLPEANPDPLKPELGQIWEGGIKVKLADNLSINAAGFYITRENVTQLLPDGLFVTQVGRQRSQGAEVEMRGQLTERWSILANYAYTDTLLNDSTHPEFDGQRALNVPYNLVNLWTRYNLIHDERRTFGLALGIVGVGQRLGDYTTPAFILPAYTRCDAGMYYTQGRFDLSVYYENIFNTVYYASSVNQFEVFPGAPFNARAQASYRF